MQLRPAWTDKYQIAECGTPYDLRPGEGGGRGMTFAEELWSAVWDAAHVEWTVRDGKVVPEAEDISNGHGVRLDATYLYADMADSSTLAQNFSKETVATVITTYLGAACRVIRHYDGHIRS